MNKDRINAYLAKRMGRCWHEFVPQDDSRNHCEEIFKNKYGIWDNFFTPLGYDKLRDWYDGWDNDKQNRFMDYILKPAMKLVYNHDRINTICGFVATDAFHRNNLAPLMYEFIRSESND